MRHSGPRTSGGPCRHSFAASGKSGERHSARLRGDGSGKRRYPRIDDDAGRCGHRTVAGPASHDRRMGGEATWTKRAGSIVIPGNLSELTITLAGPDRRRSPISRCRERQRPKSRRPRDLHPDIPIVLASGFAGSHTIEAPWDPARGCSASRSGSTNCSALSARPFDSVSLRWPNNWKLTRERAGRLHGARSCWSRVTRSLGQTRTTLNRAPLIEAATTAEATRVRTLVSIIFPLH